MPAVKQRLVAALALSPVACAPAEEVAPQRLTARAVATVAGTDRAIPAPGGRSVRIVSEGERRFLEVELPRDAWRLSRRTRQWRAEHPLRGLRLDHSPEDRLEAPGALYRPASRVETEERELEVGHFAGGPGRLLLRLAEGEEPPELLRYRLHVPRAEERDGARWLVGGRFAGRALPVLTGEAVTVEVEASGDDLLFLTTVVENAWADEEQELGTARFRVFAGDRLLLDHAQEVEPGGSAVAHRLELALEPGAHELRLEVAGDLAYTAFLAPRLAPRLASEPDAPDVVVVLADTFRADNLALYGGERGLTPRLDAFAARSRAFRHAWSTATYTLPAHASLFGGRYPYQLGITAGDSVLSHQVETLAELLDRNGYRTGAVTEGILVSSLYGLQQGFELWDEAPGSLAATLDRARRFLDADDGRPSFLFLQTYRVHATYEAEERTRRERGAELGLEGDPKELMDQAVEVMAQERTPANEARARALLERLEPHYRAGVIDLDRELGGFLEELQERPGGAPVILFLSDHGESFFEHVRAFHGNEPFEEEARIPFLLSVPGAEPGVSDVPVSLVDVAPTVAELAGLRPPSDWLGRSVLGLRDARPLYVFQCTGKPGSTWALVEDGTKWITFEEHERVLAGEWFGVFDLERDPGEERDLSGTDPELEARVARLLAERAPGLFQPTVEAIRAELDAAQLERLEAMGYAGH